VHGAYRVVPGRFKDYLSTPKPNGYRSLHTGVFGPEQQRIEIQIRTREMHEIADLVPYALAADNHQSANARAMVEAGAAWTMAEADLTPESLASLLVRRLADPSGLARAAALARTLARPDAALRLADALAALIPAPTGERPAP
jgi:hypothetical protein